MKQSPFTILRLHPGAVVSIEAARTIKNAIAVGRIGPGERLPPERQLARTLGISRASLRDALKVLTGMGLIQVRRSRGVFVGTPESPVAASRRIADTLLLRQGPIAEGPIADLFEIREVLETQAAGWAARRATTKQIEKILRVYRELRRRADRGALSPAQAKRYDSELHRLIAVASGNSVLVQIMDNLRGLLDASRGRTVTVPGRLARSVDEMGRIVAALAQGDADEAQLEMLAHLKRGEEASVRAPGPTPRTPKRDLP